LEDVWRVAPPEEKQFLQGLVQLAVAFHHHSTGNRIGMRSVMDRGMKNLGGHADGFCGIKLTPLMRSLDVWREAVEKGETHPARPCIELKT
jgi:predicted metal-dependent hydrolase